MKDKNKTFEQFLLDNDAFEDMVKTLRKQEGIGLRKYLNNHTGPAEELINDAFLWGQSLKGWNTKQANYWMLLDCKWKQHVKGLTE